MDLIFNELSLQPLTENEYSLKERFMGLLKLYKYSKENLNFKHIVFPENISELNVTKEKTFYEWVKSISHQGDKDKILSIIKKPFSKDVLGEIVDELNGYYYENEELQIVESYCYGLATAHLKEKLCSSLSTHPIWHETILQFKKVINDDLETTVVSTFNVTNQEDFNKSEIKKFIEKFMELNLHETSLKPEEKKYHLAPHHGKEELTALCKQLINSPYVVEMKSTHYGGKDFIRKVEENGVIEIVLTKSEAGYALWVQTTGTNRIQTQAIADILEKRYS